mmetsp:Transcript_22979/g.55690  ORF Transcript_22979/g.55690 Transcript_22979/m.55690 type:complete len:323 (-) Transcript_22979:173-1141(-)
MFYLSLEPSWQTAHSMATWATGICVLISAAHITHHIRYYFRPEYQIHIVRVLLLIPVLALGSLASAVYPNTSQVWETLQECYEAFAIYSFLVLQINFLGGDSRLAQNLECAPRVKWLWPFSCWRPLAPSRENFSMFKLGVMQFVFLKPVLGIVALVCHLEGVYEAGEMNAHNAFLYIFVMVNGSLSMALYSLFMFYTLAREQLEPFNPFPKFLAMKAIISIPWLQNILFMVLGKAGYITMAGATTREAVLVYSKSLVCVEMIVMALYFAWFFPVDELWDDAENPEETQPIAAIFRVTDVFDDAGKALRPSNDIKLQASSSSV